MIKILIKSICLGLMILLVHVASAQQKSSTFNLANPDEAAIQKVLVNSRAAFDNRDLKAFAEFFIKSADLYYQVSTLDNQIIIAHGWEAMTNMVEVHMKEHPQISKSKNYASNLQIHINGNAAWANCGGGEHIMARDFIVLEKHGGQWKIAALTSQEYKQGELIVVK